MIRRPPFGVLVAAGRSPQRRVQRATESARSSFVRSGFLSRWAQEVGGRRKVPSRVISVPRRYVTGVSYHG